MRHEGVSQVDGTQLPATASVLVRVPAHQDYLVVVRSVVAQLGARLGFTFAEITDLRLAVDEACCLLVAPARAGAAPAGDLECRLEMHGDVLRVVVVAAAAGVDPPDTAGFGWNVLTALVDQLAWVDDGSTARIALEKRRDHRRR